MSNNFISTQARKSVNSRQLKTYLKQNKSKEGSTSLRIFLSILQFTVLLRLLHLFRKKGGQVFFNNTSAFLSPYSEQKSLRQQSFFSSNVVSLFQSQWKYMNDVSFAWHSHSQQQTTESISVLVELPPHQIYSIN